ncbi:MAG: flagellar basal body P-ring protein FlgI [Bdellovibrionales bacterium]|nr:flagellar basal body P-ring protein FlgI [Bdellovibrionales bacterium]
MRILLLIAALFVSDFALAARVKDVANIRGVRENQLVGYGIVVGLAGTGDSKAEFTNKSMKRMLDQLGMKVTSDDLASGNVAAVLVTATLPAFSRAGNHIDVTVHAIGDASSLKGGTLIQTPLRAANQQVYAVAQGGLLIGDDGKGGAHLTVARMPSGAIIEKDLDADFASRKMFRLTLHNPDFTTAARLAKVVNLDLGGKYAVAVDSGTIDIVVPFQYEGNAVEFLATIETLDVEPDQRAKVVVNEKTGTVVIGSRVLISKVAVSHGSISLEVGESSGKKKKGGDEKKVALLDTGASVGDLVNALNSLGVSPKDLITILQNIKAAGALQGELEIL